MTWKLTLEGRTHEVAFGHRRAPQAVTVDGRDLPVAAYMMGGAGFVADIDGKPALTVAVRDGNRILVHRGGEVWTVEVDDPLLAGAAAAGGVSGDSMIAPMPGTTLSVRIDVGDSVSEGDVLVVIESMKLETTVKAWRDGQVAEVHVAEGGAFDRGAPLVTLEPETD